MWLTLVLLVLGCFILLRSAVYFIKTISTLAQVLKVSTFTISFVVVSIATSLPELFVGIVSSLKNESNFALATVIGSNIGNLTFIAGIVAVLAKLFGVKKVFDKKHGYYSLMTTLLLILFLLDGKISRIEGIALILVYLIYTYHILYFVEQKNKHLFFTLDSKVNKNPTYTKNSRTKNSKGFLKNKELILTVFKYGIIFFLCVVGLTISAELVFRASVSIASFFHFPDIIMAFIFVSLGTSLPELVFEINAIKYGERGMAVGDLLGSVSVNTGLITGICSLISPIDVTSASLPFGTSIIFLIVSASLFILFIKTDKNINWKEGVVLILVYMVYVLVEYFGSF